MWIWLFAVTTGTLSGLLLIGVFYPAAPQTDRADIATRAFLCVAGAHVGVIVTLVTAAVAHFVAKWW